MNKRLALQAVLKGKNFLVPNRAATRLGMTNRYAYDYACEDEFFEKEMTLLDAKLMHLPLPDNYKHKVLPTDEMQPPHWKYVRFNYFP